MRRHTIKPLRILEKKVAIFKNVLLSIFVVGLAFVFMAFLGTTEIGGKFQLITGQLFSDNIPKFVLLCSGSIGTYVYLIRVRKQHALQQVNFYFLLFFSMINVLGAFSLISWIGGVEEGIEFTYGTILFPSEIDEVTHNVKLNLLGTVRYLFIINLLIGIACFAGGFYHLKTLNKD